METNSTQVNSADDEVYQDGEDLTVQEGEASTPEDGDGEQEQQGEKTKETQEKSEPPKTDWESEENPYKKRYGDSQSQVNPLVRTLMQFADYDHATKTWKPKSQATEKQEEMVDEVNKILDELDPKAKEVISKYVETTTDRKIKRAIDDYHKQNASKEEFQNLRTNAWNNTLKEFGSEMDFAKDGKVNTESPLYKLSNEILVSKYAFQKPDGSYVFTTPDAEYLATCEAYAILARREKNKTPSGKEKLGALKGKISKDRGRGELTEEEYLKMSREERDKYQREQMGI